MWRNVFYLTDEGVIHVIQVQTINRRPVRVDAEGYPLDESPGPHAPTPAVDSGIPYHAIRSRLSRKELRALREMQP